MWVLCGQRTRSAAASPVARAKPEVLRLEERISGGLGRGAHRRGLGKSGGAGACSLSARPAGVESGRIVEVDDVSFADVVVLGSLDRSAAGRHRGVVPRRARVGAAA